MAWLISLLLLGVFLSPAWGGTQDGVPTLPSGVEEVPDSLMAPGTGVGASMWGVLGSGAALGAARLAIPPRKQFVPREGLDAEGIWLGLDRRSVRAFNSRKNRASNWFLWSTVAYPSVQRLLWGESAGAWTRSLGVQLESTFLAGATTFLLKSAISRPRPYTYLHTYERSDEGPNWATSDQTFQALPSGHATLAWASSMSALSLGALNHPHASPATHFVSGLVGGGLATSSALLRVEAGAHFPTDVVAGSLVGGSIGYFVPLWHAGPRSSETNRALRWGLLGTAGGVLLSLLLTPPASPFVR